MLPYLLAIPVGLSATALVTGYLERGGFWRWLAAALACAAAVLVHLTAAMVVAPASALAYVVAVVRARRLGRPFPASRHAGVWLRPGRGAGAQRLLVVAGDLAGGDQGGQRLRLLALGRAGARAAGADRHGDAADPGGPLGAGIAGPGGPGPSESRRRRPGCSASPRPDSAGATWPGSPGAGFPPARPAHLRPLCAGSRWPPGSAWPVAGSTAGRAGRLESLAALGLVADPGRFGPRGAVGPGPGRGARAVPVEPAVGAAALDRRRASASTSGPASGCSTRRAASTSPGLRRPVRRRPVQRAAART